MGQKEDLERGVKMVLNMGLSTGHADSWLDLLDEVLDQYQGIRAQLQEYHRVEAELGVPIKVYLEAEF